MTTNLLLEGFRTQVAEGRFDPQNLKAIFLAGAGGSGKGDIAQAMFAGTGFKVLNPDKHLERFLKAAKIPLKDVGNQYSMFRKARELKNKELRHYASQRRAVIIDGTGWRYDRIEKPVKALRKLGYDCYMVFVTTSLETAYRRNNQRAEKGGRKIPQSYVRDAWAGAHKNVDNYARLFGRRNVLFIKNDKDVQPQQWTRVITPALRKLATRILDRPIENAVGRAWLAKQADPATADIGREKQTYPEEPSQRPWPKFSGGTEKEVKTKKVSKEPSKARPEPPPKPGKKKQPKPKPPPEPERPKPANDAKARSREAELKFTKPLPPALAAKYPPGVLSKSQQKKKKKQKRRHKKK